MSLNNPLIYLITKGEVTADNFPEQSIQTLKIIETAIKAGVSMIQIREKNLPARLLFELTSQAVKIRKKSLTKIIVNDRADIAFAANADGVHLTSTSISTEVVRQNFPPDFIIGVSTHTIKEVVSVKNKGADFAVFSPIFKTPAKEKYGQPQGIDKLREVVKTAGDFPIVALGGINAENLTEVFSVKVRGIAAIRLLNEIENLPQILNKIHSLTRRNE